MWNNVEGCCYYCKSKSPPVVNLEGIVKCSECRRVVDSYSIDERSRFTEMDTVHSGSSIVTTEPKNDFSPSNLRNPQNRSSDPISTATTGTETMDTSSVYDFLPSSLGNSQKPSSIIADMSDRLGLRARVKNQAIQIFKEVENQIEGKGIKKRNGLFAACIYIACRETADTTRSIAEISSVATETQLSDINDAIKFIAETMGFENGKLMDIKSTDFTTRFCNALKVDSDAVFAAHKVAESFEIKVDSKRSPASIAAAVAYRTAQIYHERNMLKDIVKASGIEQSEILETYKELYPSSTALKKL